MRNRVSFANAVFCVAPLLLVCSAHAYIREASSAGVPIRRQDNNTIQVYLNDKVVAGFTSVAGKTVITADSDPQGALKTALTNWNTASSTSNLHFQSLLTSATALDNSDSFFVIGIATTPSDVSVVGGALGVTSLIYSVQTGSVVSSDIFLSNKLTFSTVGPFSLGGEPYDLQGVVTHELGHSIGADHTNVLGATMYPYAVGTFQRLISSDEIAFLNAAYPSGPASTGIITGKVTLPGAVTLANPLVAVVDAAAGVTVGTIGNSAGTWSVSVPPGSYLVYAEPFNLAVPASKYGVASGSAFEATVLGSATSPSLVTVTVGATSTANITVNSAPTPFDVPLLGATTVGGPFVDWTEGGAAAVPAGQAADLLFAGKGFDSTLKDSNFTIFGPGITVRPGSVRVEPSFAVRIGGVLTPVLRLTIDVAARQTTALASLFVTKGTDTLSLTGTLVITPSLVVPPTGPSFTSKSVVSAASYVGAAGDGVVSPGGIYTIYAAPGTSGLGPQNFVSNAGYDASGKLATTLAGVNVTFDGVAAPLFLSFGGQLNLQVPFEVAGKATTKVIVTYNGVASSAITVPVVAAQPAFFTVTPLGSDSIVINQDGTLNTARNPAARDSYVTVYGTGVGKVSYDIPTGKGAPVFPDGYTGGFTISIGTHAPIPALFGGWTPTAVGLAQWNFQIPLDSATGTQTLKATITASGASTQTGTLYVR